MSTTIDTSDNITADAIAHTTVEELPIDPSNEISIMDNLQSTIMDLDTPMEGLTNEQTQTTQPIHPPQPTITTTATSTPPPAINLLPSRVGTPSGSNHANGNGTPSRADSVQAESATMPASAQKHGHPARQYLNEKVTPYTLEIFKRIAVEQPDNPLRVLADYFAERATELGQ